MREMRLGLKLIIFGLVLGIALLLHGCSSGGGGGETATDKGGSSAEHQPTLGIVLKTMNNPYFIKMEEAAEARAKELGIKLVVQAPEREIDVERQVTIVENFIQMDVDVIAIAPCGSREIIPAIVKANKAGVPVIILDTRVNEEEAKSQSAEYVTFIGSDNYEGGKIAARYVIEKLGGKGKVAILEGIPGHETADQRLRGFRDTIEKESQIEIVASQPANWERAMGYDVAQNILTAHPDVQAIFGCNDMMALGALEAVSQAGLEGKVLVVGFDAIEDALREIKAGRMAASVAQHPEEMGRKAVEIAKQIIDAKKAGKSISQLNIPKEIITPIELVTIENVDRFLQEKTNK